MVVKYKFCSQTPWFEFHLWHSIAVLFRASYLVFLCPLGDLLGKKIKLKRPAS